MQKQRTTLGKLTLVGLIASTNNKNEANPDTSKIAALVNAWRGNQTADSSASS